MLHVPTRRPRQIADRVLLPGMYQTTSQDTMTTAATIPPHPARWTQSVLDAIGDILERHLEQTEDHAPEILDPFAGVDIDRLAAVSPGSLFYGIELEPEWAAASTRTQVGSALDLPWVGPTFDALVTSPCYGNRMADSHDAKDDSTRITYRHKLGRPLSEGSATMMQWSGAYRIWHHAAWANVLSVLRSNALIVCNVANHIRAGEEQRVVEFHLNSWLQLGATVEEVVKVPTPKSRFGANGDLRTDGERVLVLRAPAKAPGAML